MLFPTKVVKEHVEPLVQSVASDFGYGDVEFEKVVLGNSAPRITGINVVKTYLQVFLQNGNVGDFTRRLS